MTFQSQLPRRPNFGWIVTIILVVVVIAALIVGANLMYRSGYTNGVAFEPTPTAGPFEGVQRSVQERKGTVFPNPTRTPMPAYFLNAANKQQGATVVPTATQDTFSDLEVSVQGAFFTGYGFPHSAESVETVSFDNSKYNSGYRNKTAQGSQAFLAEPGVLLYHPGEMTSAEIKRAGVAVDKISPLTQRPMDVEGAIFQQVCPEGQWLVLTLSQITIRTPRFGLELVYQPKTTYTVIIRCRYGDGARNTAHGERVEFTNYVAGGNNVMIYPKGAFISENHFWQLVNLTQKSDNCGGMEGCDNNIAVYADLNTGALSVLKITANDQITNIYANYEY